MAALVHRTIVAAPREVASRVTDSRIRGACSVGTAGIPEALRKVELRTLAMDMTRLGLPVSISDERGKDLSNYEICRQIQSFKPSSDNVCLMGRASKNPVAAHDAIWSAVEFANRFGGANILLWKNGNPQLGKRTDNDLCRDLHSYSDKVNSRLNNNVNAVAENLSNLLSRLEQQKKQLDNGMSAYLKTLNGSDLEKMRTTITSTANLQGNLLNAIEFEKAQTEAAANSYAQLQSVLPTVVRGGGRGGLLSTIFGGDPLDGLSGAHLAAIAVSSLAQVTQNVSTVDAAFSKLGMKLDLGAVHGDPLRILEDLDESYARFVTDQEILGNYGHGYALNSIDRREIEKAYHTARNFILATHRDREVIMNASPIAMSNTGAIRVNAPQAAVAPARAPLAPSKIAFPELLSFTDAAITADKDAFLADFTAAKLANWTATMTGLKDHAVVALANANTARAALVASEADALRVGAVNQLHADLTLPAVGAARAKLQKIRKLNKHTEDTRLKLAIEESKCEAEVKKIVEYHAAAAQASDDLATLIGRLSATSTGAGNVVRKAVDADITAAKGRIDAAKVAGDAHHAITTRNVAELLQMIERQKLGIPTNNAHAAREATAAASVAALAAAAAAAVAPALATAIGDVNAARPAAAAVGHELPNVHQLVGVNEKWAALAGIMKNMVSPLKTANRAAAVVHVPNAGNPLGAAVTNTAVANFAYGAVSSEVIVGAAASLVGGPNNQAYGAGTARIAQLQAAQTDTQIVPNVPNVPSDADTNAAWVAIGELMRCLNVLGVATPAVDAPSNMVIGANALAQIGASQAGAGLANDAAVGNALSAVGGQGLIVGAHHDAAIGANNANALTAGKNSEARLACCQQLCYYFSIVYAKFTPVFANVALAADPVALSLTHATSGTGNLYGVNAGDAFLALISPVAVKMRDHYLGRLNAEFVKVTGTAQDTASDAALGAAGVNAPLPFLQQLNAAAVAAAATHQPAILGAAGVGVAVVYPAGELTAGKYEVDRARCVRKIGMRNAQLALVSALNGVVVAYALLQTAKVIAAAAAAAAADTAAHLAEFVMSLDADIKAILPRKVVPVAPYAEVAASINTLTYPVQTLMTEVLKFEDYFEKVELIEAGLANNGDIQPHLAAGADVAATLKNHLVLQGIKDVINGMTAPAPAAAEPTEVVAAYQQKQVAYAARLTAALATVNTGLLANPTNLADITKDPEYPNQIPSAKVIIDGYKEDVSGGRGHYYGGRSRRVQAWNTIMAQAMGL